MHYHSIQIPLSRDDFSSAGNTERFTFDLPSSRGDTITGIKVYETKEKNNEFSMSFESETGKIQYLTYKEDWTRPTEQTKMKEVFVPDVEGRKVYFDIQSIEAFTGDTTLHVVLTLE